MPTAAHLFLPLALLLTPAGHAQTASPQTVTEQTREMSGRLRLNERSQATPHLPRPAGASVFRGGVGGRTALP